ncbi:MAG: TonB-dependent receptor [Ignavibacteria bacterium]|jgi:outer membrane receptor protein involved in Fe transport
MKKNIIWVLKMAAFYSFLGLLFQSFLVNVLFASNSVAGQSLCDITVKAKLNNITLEEALQEIEKNTGFQFFYIEGKIPLKEKTSKIIEDKPLCEILENLSSEFQLVFNRINNQITIKKLPEPEIEKPVQETEKTGSIRGRIIYASTKEPVWGANIVIMGTTMGAATDLEGNFEINKIPAGEYTIQISYIGCVQKKEVINVVADKTLELNYALQQSLVNLDEVVVTGSLSERKIRAVANAISVITIKDLENRNLSTLSSVLESIPGIEIGGEAESVGSINDGTPYDKIYMRGGAPLSNVTTSAGVKYFVDGVEVSDGSILNNMNTNDIEKIEVSRGPMSTTLYGAGSSSGVIQIFTKKGRMKSLRVNLRPMFTFQESDYTDSNPINQAYNLNISGGSGDYGYSFGGNYSLRPISRWETNNGVDYKTYGLNAGVHAKLEDLIADLKFSYSSSINGSYLSTYKYKTAVYDGWANPEDLLGNFSDDENENDGSIASLNLKHLLSDKLYHNLTLGYSRNEFTVNNFSGVYMGPSLTYMMLHYDFKKYNARYFINLNQPMISEGFNADITVGAEYVGYRYINMGSWFSNSQVDYETQSYNYTYPGYKTIYPTTTTGLFAEAVWSFQNNLFLTTGIRTEKNSGYGDDLGWYTMPRLGLTYVYDVGDFIIKPRFSIGKSSEPANPYYKTGSVSSSSIRLANPNLKPQQQSGYELGSDIYYSDILSFSFTYFNQEMTDLIVSVTTTLDPVKTYQYQNVAKADNSGGNCRQNYC